MTHFLCAEEMEELRKERRARERDKLKNKFIGGVKDVKKGINNATTGDRDAQRNQHIKKSMEREQLGMEREKERW